MPADVICVLKWLALYTVCRNLGFIALSESVKKSAFVWSKQIFQKLSTVVR